MIVSRRSLAAFLVLGAVACAPRVPVVTSPAYPDFLFPDVPPEYAASTAGQQEAWAVLQSGNVAAAEVRFTVLAGRDPEFYPATAGLGWVELARGAYAEAVARFDAALDRDPAYVPALVGRGDALVRGDDLTAALRSFEAALEVDPGLTRVDRAVAELRLRVMTTRLAEARAAVERGDVAEAEAAYAQVIDASPDSAFLYLELAGLEQREGDLVAALRHARRASELDPRDVAALIFEGDLHEARGDLEAAEDAYRRADAFDPSDETTGRLARVRDRRRVATLPPEYQAISERDTVTRGDLAALLAVRLDQLLDDAAVGETTPIITDTRNHWGDHWILAVTQARVMAVDARYRFEPSRALRRGELADVVAGVLGLIAAIDPEGARPWLEARPRFVDMNESHLNYSSAAAAVSAGVLAAFDDGSFQPTGSVTGAEAIEAVDRLDALAREPG